MKVRIMPVFGWYSNKEIRILNSVKYEEKNNEQIVFDMFEEVATESIAEARNAYTYEEIDGCYQEAKEIANVVKDKLECFKNNVDWICYRIVSDKFSPSC